MNTGTLKSVLELAVKLTREGRQGRKVGTFVVVGDTGAVMKTSRPMTLDAVAGHRYEKRRIADPDVRETLEELSQLDGAFVVYDGGVALSAARYEDVAPGSLEIPLRLGSRHMAVASVSSRTRAVAVVVSESFMVGIVEDGKLVREIVPEVWMLDGYGTLPDTPRTSRTHDGVTAESRNVTDEEERMMTNAIPARIAAPVPRGAARVRGYYLSSPREDL